LPEKSPFWGDYFSLKNRHRLFKSRPVDEKSPNLVTLNPYEASTHLICQSSLSKTVKATLPTEDRD
jgi:hypothetical protein